MKAFLKSILFTALIGAAACTSSSENSNEAVSDTASIFDTTRLNISADTSAVLDVKANGATQSATPTQYQESNGKQAPRTNVGEDTTGKQAHD